LRQRYVQSRRASVGLAFHRAALDLGSLGLDPLRAALARI
jgi:hypothetical protein